MTSRKVVLRSSRLGWVRDEAVYVQAGTHLARFEVGEAKSGTIAEWSEPALPELKAETRPCANVVAAAKQSERVMRYLFTIVVGVPWFP